MTGSSTHYFALVSLALCCRVCVKIAKFALNLDLAAMHVNKLAGTRVHMQPYALIRLRYSAQGAFDQFFICITSVMLSAVLAR